MSKDAYTFEQRIGHRIANLRREAGMRQHELARALNVTVSTISHYESGTNMPQIGVLASIARIFGVSVDYLIGQTELRMDWQTFRRNITLIDGTVISLESVINQLMTLTQQSQADIFRLIRLFLMDDELRGASKDKEDNFNQDEAELMIKDWLDSD